MCVSTGADVSLAPSIEQFVSVSGCGRGHDRGCDFVGLANLEEVVVPM